MALKRTLLSDEPLYELTEREIEVLCYIMEGLSYPQIGQRLVLSERTIERHAENIFGKLGVSSRHQATLYGLSRRDILTKLAPATALTVLAPTLQRLAPASPAGAAERRRQHPQHMLAPLEGVAFDRQISVKRQPGESLRNRWCETGHAYAAAADHWRAKDAYLIAAQQADSPESRALAFAQAASSWQQLNDLVLARRYTDAALTELSQILETELSPEAWPGLAPEALAALFRDYATGLQAYKVVLRVRANIWFLQDDFATEGHVLDALETSNTVCPDLTAPGDVLQERSRILRERGTTVKVRDAHWRTVTDRAHVEESIPYLQQARSQHLQAGRRLEAAHDLRTEAKVARLLGRKGDAEKLEADALEHFGASPTVGSLYLDQARWDMAEGEGSRAKSRLDDVQELAWRLQSTHLLSAALATMADLIRENAAGHTERGALDARDYYIAALALWPQDYYPREFTKTALRLKQLFHAGDDAAAIVRQAYDPTKAPYVLLPHMHGFQQERFERLAETLPTLHA